MNRRHFLQTVGGAAAGALLPAGVEAEAAAARQAAPVPPPASRIAVLWQPGLPTVDADPVPERTLHDALTGFTSSWLDADALAAQLARDRFDVVLTPYGSAIPRLAWPALRAFLAAGGNWVNLGGAPCSVPVARDGSGWRAEMPQTTLHDVLGITQAFSVEIPAGAAWTTHPDYPWAADLVGRVRATRAFGFYARLTESKFFPDEDGSDGPRHAALEPLVTVMRADDDGTGAAGAWPVAAPVVMMDRLAGEFAGGRWLLVTGNGAIDGEAIRLLVAMAAAGRLRLSVTPSLACYSRSEAASVAFALSRPDSAAGLPVRAPVTHTLTRVSPTFESRASGSILMPGSAPRLEHTVPFEGLTPGFYRLDARFGPDAGVPAELRGSTGFWIREPAVLARSRAMTADAFTLRRDGAPFIATGTTYMAGDVHRQFLLEPNPAIWHRDFAQMRRAGVNIVRTGIWTGWSRYMPEPGRMNENALRALDAFMLTAAAHDMAVVFTFFAFTPPLWGGVNPYLDPKAVDAQASFVTAIVSRHTEMKGVTWDLINEPSVCSPQRLWSTRPNYDDYEAKAWRDWLAARFSSSSEAELDARLQEYWRTLPGEALALPALGDFDDANIFASRRPLKALEYRLFAQDVFRRWAERITAAIRSAGSPAHLVTVGQDEGGTGDRPSNLFFGRSVDLTSIHTWWNNDDLLWDTVVSKHPARANLAQETGVMFYETADGRAWRTEAGVRDLFERKLALGVGVSGAGFINWIWNTNPVMASDNEAAIGLFRPDGTAKPEFDAWRAIARFTRDAAPSMTGRQREDVVMVIPHANQFSVRTHAIAATRRAVRAMQYHARTPMAAVSEFDVGAWPVRPRLVILPSPRILTQHAWAALRAWVEQGSTLLVTGPFDDDEHWMPTGRMHALGLPATRRPVMPEEALTVDGVALVLRYRGEKMHRIDAAAMGGDAASNVVVVPVGRGRVIWSPLPVELAEEVEPTAACYAAAMKAAGLRPAITSDAGSGVLIHPARYSDAVLYTLLSEKPGDDRVAFTDNAAGVSLNVGLRGGRAALVLVNRATRRVIADYPRGGSDPGFGKGTSGTA